MRFHISAVTDVGLLRYENEDFFLIAGNEERIGFGNHDQGELAGDGDFIAVVADGLGGMEAGAYAARVTVEAINAVWKGRSPETPIQKVLEDGLRNAHEIIERESTANPNRAGAGATVGAVVRSGNLCVVATVGDVAVILKRGDEFFQPFSTDIFYRAFPRSGGSIRSDPKKPTYVLEALGIPNVGLLASIGVFEPLPGDAILILSDGVHQRLGEDRVHELTQSDTFADLPSCLVAAGNAAGGEDNLTAVLCRFATNRDTVRTIPSLESDFQVIRLKPSPQ